VQVSIVSSGKKSEPHTFTYTPKGQYTTLAAASTLSNTIHAQGIYLLTKRSITPKKKERKPTEFTNHKLPAGDRDSLAL